MNSPPTQFIAPRRMAIVEPLHQIDMWDDYKDLSYANASAYVAPDVDAELDNQSENVSHGVLATSSKYEQEEAKPFDKVQRRLAQNREAARKSRLRKKAYVQQLETSRLKLTQLEHELEQVRQQGVYIGGGLDGGHQDFRQTVNSGIASFDMEYGQWIEKQNRQICELRNALNSHTVMSDIELRPLVDGGLTHYFELFRMKATAAEADVFFLISGVWKTSAERFFSWIGGLRPSEILKVLVPQLDNLTEQQRLDICDLLKSCQQVEDALSRGMEKLQQTLSEAVVDGQLGDGIYIPQIPIAMQKLDALVKLVNQADHLRKETLKQMYNILTLRQAARGLLALGEYLQRLRALSSLWDTSL